MQSNPQISQISQIEKALDSFHLRNLRIEFQFQLSTVDCGLSSEFSEFSDSQAFSRWELSLTEQVQGRVLTKGQALNRKTVRCRQTRCPPRTQPKCRPPRTRRL